MGTQTREQLILEVEKPWQLEAASSDVCALNQATQYKKEIFFQEKNR